MSQIKSCQVRSSFRQKSNEVNLGLILKESEEGKRKSIQESTGEPLIRSDRHNQSSGRDRQSVNLGNEPINGNIRDKTFSKSLQDNRFASSNNKINQEQVIFNVLNSETKNEPESETVSVKSKIKLMESFVSSRSKPVERSSSSSSSSSSTKSPPLSPHEASNRLLINKQPSKPNETSLQSMPSFKMTSSHSKQSLQKETEIIENNSIEEFKPEQPALSSLKERRRTVKELMSKFEPK